MKNILFIKGKCGGERYRVSDDKASRLVASGLARYDKKKYIAPVIGERPNPIIKRGKAPAPLIHPSNPNHGASGRGSKPREKGTAK